MKLIAIKCPQCEASLDIDKDRKECFCSYCGNKILLDDGSRTFTHIYVNKAREKELELEEKRLFEDQLKNTINFRLKIISAIAACVAVLFALVTFVVIRSDFNITFNFCLMLLGCATAIARILRKGSVFGIIILSVITTTACLAFIIMRDDFNTTFTMALALTIAFHAVASIIKKSD